LLDPHVLLDLFLLCYRQISLNVSFVSSVQLDCYPFNNDNNDNDDDNDDNNNDDDDDSIMMYDNDDDVDSDDDV